MKTRLIFVRHGFSESNKSRTFTGQTDVPLAEAGEMQAKMAAEYLSATKLDKIYSSPLGRAFKTALPIAQNHGLDIITDPGLSEIYGGRWENQPFDNLAKIDSDAYDCWMNDLYNCTCPDGESVRDFCSRILSTATKIAEQNAGKCICIATHATPIRVMLCCALGLPLHKIQDIPFSPNASINIIDYQDGNFFIVEKNITSHLGDLVTALPKNV
jgi:probable phosphoglycerate mutase